MSLSRALLPLRQHACGTARLSAVVAALPSTSRYLIPGRFGAAVYVSLIFFVVVVPCFLARLFSFRVSLFILEGKLLLL